MSFETDTPKPTVVPKWTIEQVCELKEHYCLESFPPKWAVSVLVQREAHDKEWISTILTNDDYKALKARLKNV